MQQTRTNQDSLQSTLFGILPNNQQILMFSFGKKNPKKPQQSNHGVLNIPQGISDFLCPTYIDVGDGKELSVPFSAIAGHFTVL